MSVRRLTYAGHAWRKQGSKIRTVIEKKNPAGKRLLGRLRLRWEVCVSKYVGGLEAGKLRREVTEDRYTQKNICLESWSYPLKKKKKIIGLRSGENICASLRTTLPIVHCRTVWRGVQPKSIACKNELVTSCHDDYSHCVHVYVCVQRSAHLNFLFLRCIVKRILHAFTNLWKSGRTHVSYARYERTNVRKLYELGRCSKVCFAKHLVGRQNKFRKNKLYLEDANSIRGEGSGKTGHIYMEIQ